MFASPLTTLRVAHLHLQCYAAPTILNLCVSLDVFDNLTIVLYLRGLVRVSSSRASEEDDRLHRWQDVQTGWGLLPVSHR